MRFILYYKEGFGARRILKNCRLKRELAVQIYIFIGALMSIIILSFVIGRLYEKKMPRTTNLFLLLLTLSALFLYLEREKTEKVMTPVPAEMLPPGTTWEVIVEKTLQNGKVIYVVQNIDKKEEMIIVLFKEIPPRKFEVKKRGIPFLSRKITLVSLEEK